MMKDVDQHEVCERRVCVRKRLGVDDLGDPGCLLARRSAPPAGTPGEACRYRTRARSNDPQSGREPRRPNAASRGTALARAVVYSTSAPARAGHRRASPRSCSVPSRLSLSRRTSRRAPIAVRKLDHPEEPERTRTAATPVDQRSKAREVREADALPRAPFEHHTTDVVPAKAVEQPLLEPVELTTSRARGS